MKGPIKILHIDSEYQVVYMAVLTPLTFSDKLESIVNSFAKYSL